MIVWGALLHELQLGTASLPISRRPPSYPPVQQHLVNVRFYIDPETDEAHVESHGISVDEAEEVLAAPLVDYPGTRGTRIAVGQTSTGRYIRVIYVPDRVPGSIFVITAYDLPPKALRALRRRLRRRS